MIGLPIEPTEPAPAGYKWVRLAPSHLVHIADSRNTTVSLCDVPTAHRPAGVPEAGGELCERCRRLCPMLRGRRP